MSDMPCPLCGREMTTIETYAGRGELYCGHCDLTIGGNEAKTPDELTALLEQQTKRSKQVMDAGNVVNDVLDHITKVTNDLGVSEKLMVLCTIGKHCKAYTETVLAHEYLRALYGRKVVSE